MTSTTSFVPYEYFVTGFRIAATILFIIGAGSNITVVVISATTKKDSKAFVLLMQIHACASALHSTAGWLSANRHPDINNITVFITYGLCEVFGPRFCAACDIIPILSNSFIPALISVMMVCRALIMYQFRLAKIHVIVVVALLILVMLPLAYLVGIGYVDINSTGVIPYLLNSTDPQNLNYAKEIQSIGGYTVRMSGLAFFIFPIYNWIPPISLAICLVFRILMEYKHRQFTGQVSESTKKIYRGFMHLLTLDAIVEFIYVLASRLDIVQSVSDAFPGMATFLTFFSHCFFALPAVIQGLSLLTNDNLILLVSLAFIDFVYAVLQFPYLIILIREWTPDGEPFNYDPAVIVPLVGPSAALMKSGCTVTTAIALDRILAFYFPVRYYQLSKRRWSTGAFFFAIFMAFIDWCVLQLTVIKFTPQPNGNCSSFACFTHDIFRSYWGLSNMLMNFASCVLTVLIIYHLYQRPAEIREVEKQNRAKIDKSANRVAMYILLVSALIGVVPGCLNGVGTIVHIQILDEVSFFVGTSATLSGLSHAFIFAMAHREIQRAILKLFGMHKKTVMLPRAASFLNPVQPSSSTGHSTRSARVYNVDMRRHM